MLSVAPETAFDEPTITLVRLAVASAALYIAPPSVAEFPVNVVPLTFNAALL